MINIDGKVLKGRFNCFLFFLNHFFFPFNFSYSNTNIINSNNMNNNYMNQLLKYTHTQNIYIHIIEKKKEKNT